MGILIAAGIVILLYFLAILPRMAGRPDRTPFYGRLYAHRGLHDNDTDAPENSMPAFRKAVEAGYGIELDVQLTKDRVPVVFHDFTLKRICGQPGKVSDYTFEELQAFRLCGSGERIPKFEDFLKLAAGKVPLIIEYKIEWTDTEVCRLADALLQDYPGVYCIESFNPLGLIWYRNHRRDIMRGQLSMNYSKTEEYRGKLLYAALQFLLLNGVTKPDFIAFDHKGADNLSFRLCTGLFGALPVAWTIKSEEELARARKRFSLFIFDSFVPKEKE
jgi:glycerophosphoryl diester phosphodiesterase